MPVTPPPPKKNLFLYFYKCIKACTYALKLVLKNDHYEKQSALAAHTYSDYRSLDDREKESPD